ncbi:MAG: DUF7134 domain-containing protein, partial [Mycobacteriaceae bacterium]
MRRLSLWLRSRPMVGDGLLSVMVVLLSVVLLAPQAHPTSYLLISFLLSAPLVIRRRYPELAAVLVLALGAGQLILMPDTVVVPADLALAIVLYTLV